MKQKFKGYWLGKHRDEKTKIKISEGHKGKPSGALNKHWKLSEKAKKNISNGHKGEKSRFWEGGITTYERKLYLNGRRRAIKKQAEGTHTQGEWELLKKQYGYICPCCKKGEPEIKLTEDHIISLSRGGSDYIENIQPLCRSCNCKKYIKIIKYEL